MMTVTEQSREASRACDCTHGTAGDLLRLIPGPAVGKATGDPFITLSGRAAKAWLALFFHARTHGTWLRRYVDPSRPELIEGPMYALTARWTVSGLAYSLGANRDTAGKAMRELVEGGWVRREDARNKGQFGGFDYSLCTPSSVTHADKAKVRDGLTKRGVEYRDYQWRTAARVLEENEISQIRQDVELEIEIEQADLVGDDARAIDLASKKVLRHA